jgi:hypothetical protein
MRDQKLKRTSQNIPQGTDPFYHPAYGQFGEPEEEEGLPLATRVEYNLSPPFLGRTYKASNWKENE